MTSEIFKSKLKALPQEYFYLFVFHLSKNNLPYLKEFVRTLPTIGVISIQYSERPEVKEEISKFTSVYTPKVEDIPDTILNLCEQASGKKVIIMEIGGYSALVADKLSNVVLSVEDTTRGHERFIEYQDKLTYPVVSIARTQGKKLEDKFIGKAITQSVTNICNEALLGDTLTKKTVLVLGYGGVGEATANELQNRAEKVFVYDKDSGIQSKALMQGYLENSREDALKSADVVVGCSGYQSVALKDMSLLKENALLVSGSSRQVEFPYKELLPYKIEFDTKAPLEKFKINNRSFYVAYKAQPLNFFYDIALGEVFDIPMTLMVESVLYGTRMHLENTLTSLPDRNNDTVVKAITKELNLQL